VSFRDDLDFAEVEVVIKVMVEASRLLNLSTRPSIFLFLPLV
jgi:hypothetical protein